MRIGLQPPSSVALGGIGIRNPQTSQMAQSRWARMSQPSTSFSAMLGVGEALADAPKPILEPWFERFAASNPQLRMMRAVVQQHQATGEKLACSAALDTKAGTRSRPASSPIHQLHDLDPLGPARHTLPR